MAKKILIIDDDVFNTEVLIDTILFLTNKNNIEVDFKSIEDGKTALEYIDEKDSIDLIFLDIKIPEISGDKLLPIFREKIPTVPIVCHTASAMIEQQKKFKELYDYILIKPIDEKRVAEILGKFEII